MTKVLDVKNLRVYFHTPMGPVKAVDGISFDLNPKERLGIVGESGSGKSTMALSLMRLIKKNGKRAIYTTPIKALSNQKYGDFQKKFSGSCVGILTGDIKVNPDAQILVATQEIICNLLYTNIEYFEDVGTLVIDETHYLRDADRGTIYEQTIAMIPKNIVLVMLSATLPGAQNLAKWVEDIKEKPCVMTSTNVRPVPLVHQVYWNGEYKQVLEGDHNFDEQAYKSMFNVWKESKNVRLKDKPSDSTTLIKFLDNLSERELFPALFFQFSRKG
jgi:antiviral helicase SKI2